MSHGHDHQYDGQDMQEENFAELFEQSVKKGGNRLAPGQKITGTVLKVGSEWIFIDTGHKGEGIIDRKEFTGADGAVTVAVGDTVSAYFLSSSHGEMRFTTSIGASGSNEVEEAWRAGVPVTGQVEREIKGGYEIKLGGTTRAFCPFSQMGLRRTDDPQSLIGTRLAFRITDYGERGRNIVLSRRVLLEEEQQRLREESYAGLEIGAKVTGTVTSLQDYGAFVEFGGLEGLVPVSEMAWGRVKDVREFLKIGQPVQAVVKSIDRAKDRISLSLKDTQADPWEQAAARFPKGSFHMGEVVRLTQFGAFVALGGGIDGLIHISKLGGGRKIQHPREAVKEGDTIEVKVEGVDVAQRRISLAPAGATRAADEEEATLAEFRSKAAEAPKGMGTLGDLLKAKMQKKR